MNNEKPPVRRIKRKTLRRKRKIRFFLLLLFLLLCFGLFLTYCQRKRPSSAPVQPSPSETLPPATAQLHIFDQTIPLRETSISFEKVNYASDPPTITKREYLIPKELYPKLISLLQEHLNYRQGPGSRLKEEFQNYIILKLNLNEKLEIGYNFVSSYGQDTEGKDIPRGKYMYIDYFNNYYNASGRVQYVYLSKDNLMEALKSFVQSNQLQGQEIIKGQ